MRIPRVYIDASVVGGCFDREFSVESLALFDMARRGDIKLVVSDLLAAEISLAPAQVSEFLATLSPGIIEIVSAGDEAVAL